MLFFDFLNVFYIIMTIEDILSTIIDTIVTVAIFLIILLNFVNNF